MPTKPIWTCKIFDTLEKIYISKIIINAMYNLCNMIFLLFFNGNKNICTMFIAAQAVLYWNEEYMEDIK